MHHQRLGIEAQVVGIGADHFQRFHALGHARHVAVFDGLDMIGVDAGHLSGIVEAFAAALALALQIPARLARGIERTVRLLADGGAMVFKGFAVGFRANAVITHVLTLGYWDVNGLLTQTFP